MSPLSRSTGTHPVEPLDDGHADARYDLDVALLALALDVVAALGLVREVSLDLAPSRRGAVEARKLDVLRERTAPTHVVYRHAGVRKVYRAVPAVVGWTRSRLADGDEKDRRLLESGTRSSWRSRALIRTG